MVIIYHDLIRVFICFNFFYFDNNKWNFITCFAVNYILESSFSPTFKQVDLDEIMCTRNELYRSNFGALLLYRYPTTTHFLWELLKNPGILIRWSTFSRLLFNTCKHFQTQAQTKLFAINTMHGASFRRSTARAVCLSTTCKAQCEVNPKSWDWLQRERCIGLIYELSYYTFVFFD